MKNLEQNDKFSPEWQNRLRMRNSAQIVKVVEWRRPFWMTKWTQNNEIGLQPKVRSSVKNEEINPE